VIQSRADYGRITGYPEVVDYQLAPDDVVLDVGGYLGDWTAALNHPGPTFIFEPVPEFASILRKRFDTHSNITVMNTALSDRSGPAHVVVSDDGSYMADMGETANKLDVVGFFRIFVRDTVALVSINIEGHEYTLVPRIIESGLINKIDRIQIQFHENVPNAYSQRDAIREKLVLTHVETYCHPFVWESWTKR
jgi:FkbM family methyltransferase